MSRPLVDLPCQKADIQQVSTVPMTSAVFHPTDDSLDQRCNVLGVRVSAVNLDLAADRIDRWIQSGSKNYVCITGVHGVMESQDNPQLKAIHNAADSMEG